MLKIINFFCIFFLFLFELSLSASGYLDIEGTLIDIDAASGVYKIRQAENLTVLFTSGREPLWGERSVSIFALKPGDRIFAKIASGSNLAYEVRVSGNFYSGELLFADKDKILLEDGTRIYVNGDTVYKKNSVVVKQEEVLTGARAYVRVDPKTCIAGTVELVDFTSSVTKINDCSLTIGSISIAILRGGKVFPGKSCRFGDVLAVKVNASPGKKASFDIAGIAAGVPLKEKSPGIYSGSIRINYGDSRRSYVIVKISDKVRSTVKINPEAIDVAVTPPKIIPLSPEPGGRMASNYPIIYAEFKSAGSLINAASAEVYLDGVPIVGSVTKTYRFLRAESRKAVSKGRHYVKIKVSDCAGNTSFKEWSFYVM